VRNKRRFVMVSLRNVGNVGNVGNGGGAMMCPSLFAAAVEVARGDYPRWRAA
jgi:hypothetical protein